MEDKTISRLRHVNKSTALQTLRLTKITLLIFLLGICVVGKRKSTWPIVSWALYSEYSARFRPPKPLVSATELRVYTTTGKLHIVRPEHILTVPRDSLSHEIVEHAFDESDISLRDASRKYLMNAVSKLIHENLIHENSEIKTIEAWEISYKVEPLAVPPIQLQYPISEVMLDRFAAEDLIGRN